MADIEPNGTADLEQREVVRGRQPGNRYVRIVRPFSREFRRKAAGHLVASEQVLAPTTSYGRAADRLRRLLFGERIATEHELRERIGVAKGLAVFASDNISSSAYASEEIMRVVVLAGVGAMAALTLPITAAIVIVLAIVVASYQQTIRAYPNGGGSYIVASDNLGPIPGLVAAGALLTDYVLTVAVSIAAGVAAITSIFPATFEYRVAMGVAFVAILALGNLRGLRESATIFAVPTYIYLLAIYGLLAYGLFRFVTGTLPEYTAPPEWARGVAEPLGLFLVLRAFASGSVALTGTEAVSNGVPAFKPPEWRHAQIVLILMGTFFGTIFLGMSFLAGQLGIVPDPTEQETVVSQLTRAFVGEGTPYHLLVQISTSLLLVLAANTAFADFPRLSSILAKDRFMPHYFQFRGDRLAFTTGIVVLALLSAVLIVAFSGSVTNLIPLYTIGVFVAFTLSQSGMVRRWWKLREPGWRWRAAMNGLGAIATGIVAVVVGVAKFEYGAWMVLVLIPILIALMWGIHRHYRVIEDELTLDASRTRIGRRASPRVVVPIGRVDRAALEALAFARSIAPHVTAVHVTDDAGEAERMKDRWEQLEQDGDVELVILESPYRALIQPLIAYIDALAAQDPDRPITIVLSEFVPRHFWEYFLHNQAALRLKVRLFFRPNTVVVDVPYHVEA